MMKKPHHGSHPRGGQLVKLGLQNWLMSLEMGMMKRQQRQHHGSHPRGGQLVKLCFQSRLMSLEMWMKRQHHGSHPRGGQLVKLCFSEQADEPGNGDDEEATPWLTPTR